MIKYNYKAAADLWDLYYHTACDPWTLCDDEKQKERRYFMRAVTRHKDIKQYIDHLYETIDDARPIDDAKSRVYDFKYERELENIIWQIKSFKGVLS